MTFLSLALKKIQRESQRPGDVKCYSINKLNVTDVAESHSLRVFGSLR